MSATQSSYFIVFYRHSFTVKTIGPWAKCNSVAKEKNQQKVKIYKIVKKEGNKSLKAYRIDLNCYLKSRIKLTVLGILQIHQIGSKVVKLE